MWFRYDLFLPGLPNSCYDNFLPFTIYLFRLHVLWWFHRKCNGCYLCEDQFTDRCFVWWRIASANVWRLANKRASHFINTCGLVVLIYSWYLVSWSDFTQCSISFTFMNFVIPFFKRRSRTASFRLFSALDCFSINYCDIYRRMLFYLDICVFIQVMGSQQFCLRWNNHQSNILTVFDKLLSNGSFVDVTLACEGSSLKAHKMVLSACSPFFEEIFIDNPCKHPVVIMRDIKLLDLKAIIEFMYKGEVSVGKVLCLLYVMTCLIRVVRGWFYSCCAFRWEYFQVNMF